VGPNPSHGSHVTLYVDLDGNASLVNVAIYSRANTLVLQTSFNGSFHAGWNQVPLPPLNLPNGIYYVRVEVGLSRKFTTLMVLR
jgi:hypothetical protein